ncbi:hypothetical protein Cni_G24231 [Canna indica]|uniref:Calmodulin-binding domain-containing protein n=1 Tax=Canna indica TaxID=4628 RepID=A0AAQ3QPC4_9LILI|nr:hypothetical protein Cni_G24231 [Canna indica]
MTEEVIISLSPGDLLPEIAARTNETVKTDAITSSSPSSSGLEILSRYLRSPQGSCHDLCKYGFKNHDEDEKKRPFFPKFFCNNQLPNRENQLIFMTIQKERQKSELVAVQERRQKLKLKPRESCVNNGITGKLEINEKMDLPPEKIIQTANSTTKLAEKFVQESSSFLKLSTPPNDQTNNASLVHSTAKIDENSSEVSMDTATDDHGLANPSKGMFNEFVIGLHRTVIQNDAIEEHLPTSNIDGPTMEPNNINVIMSSTIAENIASPQCKVENMSKGSSAEHINMQLVIASPVTDDIVSDECQTSIEGESFNELTNIKKALPESSEPSNLIMRNHKGKVSVMHRPINRAGLASKEGLHMNLKNQLVKEGPESTNTMQTDQARFPQRDIQLKSSIIHEKTKRKLNKPKNGIKETGVTYRRKAINKEQGDTSDDPKFIQKNSTPRKRMKFKMESARGNSIDFATASVAPIVVKKSTASRYKTINESDKSTSTLKLKKVMENSSSQSIYSRGLSVRSNQEKLIKVANKWNDAGGKALRSLSTAPSTKPQLRKYRKSVPSFTMNNLANPANFGLKEKTTSTSELNLEEVDLKALRQKLKKYKSSPDRKEHEGSGSGLGDVPKSEMKSISESITSFDTEDKVGSSHRLNFARGKVVDLQPENKSPPRRLIFKRVKMASSNHSAKDMGTKSYKNKVETYVGGSNTSPPKSIKIALKHKDVVDKKDEQGLFNNVIEETASKLAESRKSKVKALVGAFETVISLQETKVSPVVAVP